MANCTSTPKNMKAEDGQDGLKTGSFHKVLASKDWTHSRSKRSKHGIPPWKTLSLSTPLPTSTLLLSSSAWRNWEGTQLGKVDDQLLTSRSICKSHCLFLHISCKSMLKSCISLNFSHLEKNNNIVELFLLILFPNSHAHENHAFLKKVKITAHLSL